MLCMSVIHFISFHFISFHFISFHFISFHSISFHFYPRLDVSQDLGQEFGAAQPELLASDAGRSEGQRGELWAGLWAGRRAGLWAGHGCGVARRHATAGPRGVAAHLGDLGAAELLCLDPGRTEDAEAGSHASASKWAKWAKWAASGEDICEEGIETS